VTAPILHVGLDDTDNLESIGTGRLARMLAEHLEEAGLLRDTSVTRHQLLVHPDIPYTSHTSSACVAGEAAATDPARVLAAARAFVETHFHEGANPGLCVVPADAVPAAARVLARRAQREVLDLGEVDRVLEEAGLAFWSGGETGQGRVGAVSATALRAGGDDGRFIGLRGIRDLRGVLPVRAVLEGSAVAAVVDEDGAALEGDAPVDTLGWVRPALRGGRPVLVVRREEGRFVPADRRKGDDG
jgi:hypothetical protein